MNGWRRARLDEICEVIGGSTPSTADARLWDGDIAWITPADLGALTGREIARGARNISDFGLAAIGRTLSPPGSVVLSTRAPIGHVAITIGPTATNQGCKTLVPRPDVDVRFLHRLVKSHVPELQQLGSGATFTELSKAKLEAFEVEIPPLEEQRRIVAMLDEQLGVVERARAAARAQFDELDDLAAALVTQALTGRAS